MFQNDVQGVLALRDNMEKRACDLAVYIIENRTTIRAAAKEFGVSKSTVHKDLTQRLDLCNHGLYLQVKQVLEKNKAERHIRGGIATRNKYRHTGAIENPAPCDDENNKKKTNQSVEK